MNRRIRLVASLVAAAWLGGADSAAALSTFTARFVGGIVGPDIEQTAVLYVHYFPGDGEAIVGADFDCDHAVLNLAGAESSRGTVRALRPAIRVDYGEAPLGGESVDTLRVELRATQSQADLEWQGTIYSSADPGGGVAHRAAFALQVRPALGLELGVAPDRVFAGQRADLLLTVHNVDPRDRALEELVLFPPEGLSVLGGETTVGWKQPLAPGETDTLSWQVLVDQEAAGALVLRGTARSARLHESPAPLVRVLVATPPRARVSWATALAEVGKSTSFVYECRNPGTEPIALAGLRVEIPEAFAEVALSQRLEGASLTVGDSGRGGRIEVTDLGVLEAGAAVELAVQAKPLRPGSFPWKGSFSLPGATARIPVAGETVVSAVLPRPQAGPGGDGLAYPTDVQLVNRALSEAFGREAEEFLLPRGATICLEPDEAKGEDWLVEDVLHQVLMRWGYRVLLEAPDTGDRGAEVLYYRKIDSGVVYSPLKRGWGLSGSWHRREAYGDLLLRLEVAGRAVWARRVRASRADEVPESMSELLGGSEVVERTVIKSSHKLIERGLSASIVGGLIYIFFAP